MNHIAFRTHTHLTLKMSGAKPMVLGIVLAMTFMIPHRSSAAGQAAVNLGSAAHSTLLAGAAITTTGGGTINGDVGAYPIAGSAIGLTAAQVHGTIYAVDATGPVGAVIAPAL